MKKRETDHLRREYCTNEETFSLMIHFHKIFKFMKMNTINNLQNRLFFKKESKNSKLFKMIFMICQKIKIHHE